MSRKFIKTLTLISLTGVLGLEAITASAQLTEKPRVIAMTDGEIDDRSSMVRFLLYTNDIELVAIIQTSSCYQRQGWSQEKWIEQQIDAYEQVYPNLAIHDPAYPTAEELRTKLYVGDEDRSHVIVDGNSKARIPGTEPVIDPSEWSDTPGSDKIVEVLLEDDPRPVYIQAWGGGNTAARAFYKLKKEYPNDYKRALSKVVMYNIWYQDGAGNYIERHFPEVTMVLSYYFSGSWDYGSQRYTRQFVKEYVRNNHGPLGALYPQHYISEGDSPAYLYSVSNGLRSHENPTYGGWGGLFYKVDGLNVYRDYDLGSYKIWVEYANRDFEARLDWCIKDKYEEANHKPIILIPGPLDRSVQSGDTVHLEAEIEDNDNLDLKTLWDENSGLYMQHGMNFEQFEKSMQNRPKFDILWWQYKEAGTYDGVIETSNPNQSAIQFVAPKVDEPSTIHLILQVTDKGTPALTSFVRRIITVLPNP